MSLPAIGLLGGAWVGRITSVSGGVGGFHSGLLNIAEMVSCARVLDSQGDPID